MPDRIDDSLPEAAAILAAAGIDGARREARWLAASAVGADDRDPLPAVFGPGQRKRFDALIARRSAREPLQHVLGDTEFFGLQLATDRRALIPRPDSECVVERALETVPLDAPSIVADLGTGSGCLLLAILAHRPKARGVGIDASAAAVALARENAERTGLAGRADMTCVDWRDWTGWRQADVIVSNPPYIRTAEIAALAPEVRDHDPHAALDGGSDGLDAYRELIGLAAAGMKPGAWLFLEIGHDQRDAVCDLLAARPGMAEITAGQDLAGRDRLVRARKQRD